MDSYSYLNISAGPGTGALDLFVAGTEEVYVFLSVDRGWGVSLALFYTLQPTRVRGI